MKKLIILFSLVLIGLNLSAQTDSVKYYFNKAYISSDYKYQIVNYTKCIRVNPSYKSAYINRGIAYGKLGKYQLAIDDFSRVIRMNPNDAGAYYNRGNTYDKLGKHQLAIDDYSRVIKIKPNYVGYFNRGNTYGKLGKYQLAIDDYSRVIKMNPNYKSAYINRGIAKWNLKLAFCSDFKRACDLGQCDNYYKACK